MGVLDSEKLILNCLELHLSAQFERLPAGQEYLASRGVVHFWNGQMLKLRSIGIHDYSVVEDGQCIGRIRFAGERQPSRRPGKR